MSWTKNGNLKLAQIKLHHARPCAWPFHLSFSITRRSPLMLTCRCHPPDDDDGWWHHRGVGSDASGLGQNPDRTGSGWQGLGRPSSPSASSGISVLLNQLGRFWLVCLDGLVRFGPSGSNHVLRLVQSIGIWCIQVHPVIGQSGSKCNFNFSKINQIRFRTRTAKLTTSMNTRKKYE